MSDPGAPQHGAPQLGPPPSYGPASYAPPPSYVAPPSYGPPPALTTAPPPAAPYGPYAVPARPPQRPAVVGLASTLTVMASLQWLCVLSFAWLVASLGADELQRAGETGPVFHILNRFNYRMIDGLAWPFYLLPLASCVLGFLILAQRPWARMAFTALGVLALAWSAWLLRNDLVWWLAPAVYIAVATAVVWTRDATSWYRWRPSVS